MSGAPEEFRAATEKGLQLEEEIKGREGKQLGKRWRCVEGRRSLLPFQAELEDNLFPGLALCQVDSKVIQEHVYTRSWSVEPFHVQDIAEH